MTDAMVWADVGSGSEMPEHPAFSPTGEVLRDIARGGASGLIVGIVVGGLGGRLVMRIAAILHPGAIGAMTENGNRIGDITVGGTVSLIVFGLISCAIAGAVWVIVGPWIPGHMRIRALLTAATAIAVGTPVLIIGRNPDFAILDHDPTIVALLLALVGLIGLSIALVDGWLDHRLPHAVIGHKAPILAYGVVAAIGAVLVLPFVLLIFLTSDEYQLQVRGGYALVVVGLCTATWWGLRVRGRMSPPGSLAVAARTAVVVAVTLGMLTSLGHLVTALGASS